MGNYGFRLPDIGEGVVEGEVVAWHVEVGADVKEDDPLVDVMTDKANVTIPSPVSGTVTKTVGAPGDIIAVGSVCIEFEVEGDGNAASSDDTPEPEPAPEPLPEPEPELAAEEENRYCEYCYTSHGSWDYTGESTSDGEDILTCELCSHSSVPSQEAPAKVEPSVAPEPAATSSTPVSRTGRPLASPAVRRRAKEEGVSLNDVQGTGPAGRISNDDLEAHLTAPATVGGVPISQAGVEQTGTTEVPVIGLRRKIAEQMTKSYTTIPHFSFFEEVDVTDLEALRQWMNSNRTEDQPKLTYLPFIMQALVKLFQSGHAGCNATYDDSVEIVTRHDGVNIGIATTTDRGLYVPVVKHIEAKTIWETAAELNRVAGAARDGTAGLDDLTGSTFTITSLGRDGGLGATPIINHPEVGILGVHKAIDRPMVVDGRITIRRMMNLSSSWDHRVVDGADGAALVNGLKQMLEHPISIL